MNRRNIHFEKLTGIRVNAARTGVGGVRKTDRPLLDLYNDPAICSIELANFEDGYIHFSRRENDWWIKRKGKPRDYINCFLNGKQL